MSTLVNEFTSTGSKLYWHQEAMQKLRDGQGMPISAWVAGTDLCNAKCAFCSVGERVGDVLPFQAIKGFIDQLAALGLRAVTFSGGGNFLLYKCPETKIDCNGVIEYCHKLGLQVALITNGMPLIEYPDGRKSWKKMSPKTLDMLTWVRISLAGLDHPEKEVYIPDIDHSKTTLGFSWIMSDAYEEPSHKHGWVSTPEDIRTEMPDRKVVLAEDRMPWIEEQIHAYIDKYKPKYCRLLTNCLQPERIDERHKILSDMADRIAPGVAFSQRKPPRQPGQCAKVYPHPCLNADGWVYPCDSVVLSKTANHKFGSAWRVCRWNEIGELYANPIRKVIPGDICPGCVFSDQVDLIASIVSGAPTPIPIGVMPDHVNFI